MNVDAAGGESTPLPSAMPTATVARLDEIASIAVATEVAPAGWEDVSILIESIPLQLHEAIFGPYSPEQLNSTTYVTRFLHYLRDRRLHHRVAEMRERVVTFIASQSGPTFITTSRDQTYPALLREAYNHPPLLWSTRALTDFDYSPLSLSIVGSRDVDEGVLHATRSLAGELGAANVHVVSGLAAGVDAWAHDGALIARGPTTAVLGCGIDLAPLNTSLGQRLRAHGNIVSAYMPGVPATRTSLPLRNAIISGMSRATIVLAAGEKSGTRSTIQHALAQNRPVIMWRPSFDTQSWVTELGRHDLVSFASSAQEVGDLLVAHGIWKQVSPARQLGRGLDQVGGHEDSP